MTKCDAICYIQHAFSLAFGRLIVDNMDMNFVAYVRTSTRRQNLGLESQRAIIEAHVAAVGGKLLAVYSEQECGEYETAKRPALSKAIGHAKRSKATLIVAYLSRLARSAAVGTAIEAELRRAGTAVHVCDKPGADTLTLTIYFGLAERELEDIRSRTRNSLTVIRSMGRPLGSHLDAAHVLSVEAAAKGRELGAQVNKARAVDSYADLFAEVQAMRAAGSSLRAIADALNTQGQTTRTGAAWNPTQVSRVLALAEAA